MFESSRKQDIAATTGRRVQASASLAQRLLAANDPFTPGWPWVLSGADTRWQRPVLNQEATSPLALSVDGLVIVVASLATGLGYHLAFLAGTGPVSDFFATGLLAAVLFCGITRWRMARPALGISRPIERAHEALSAWVTAFLLLLLIVFTLKVSAVLSRGAILSFFVVGMVAVVLTRVGAPIVLAGTRRTSADLAGGVAVIGRVGEPALARLTIALQNETGTSPPVITFDPETGDGVWDRECARVLERVRKLAHESGHGEIFVASAGISRKQLQQLLDGLNVLPRTVLVVPDDLTSDYLRRNVIAVGENVAVVVQKEPLNAGQRLLKRTIDVLCAGFAILLAAPLLVAVAIAIKLDSPGPVLFLQTRNGYRGRPFRILKFRTMTVLEDGAGIAQARRDDARVTRIGAWLRRSSIDELPQLFNVLKGDMSLIGPRPHAVAHDELYGRLIENYALRQHVKPGISGWAQVNGLRGETPTVDTMYRRIEFDLWYATHCSLLLDLVIMARTVLEVFRQRNAY